MNTIPPGEIMKEQHFKEILYFIARHSDVIYLCPAGDVMLVFYTISGILLAQHQRETYLMT